MLVRPDHLDTRNTSLPVTHHRVHTVGRIATAESSMRYWQPNEFQITQRSPDISIKAASVPLLVSDRLLLLFPFPRPLPHPSASVDRKTSHWPIGTLYYNNTLFQKTFWGRSRTLSPRLVQSFSPRSAQLFLSPGGRMARYVPSWVKRSTNTHSSCEKNDSVLGIFLYSVHS